MNKWQPLLFNPHIHPIRELLLLFPLYRCRYRGRRGWSNLLKVSRLVHGRELTYVKHRENLLEHIQHATTLYYWNSVYVLEFCIKYICKDVIGYYLFVGIYKKNFFKSSLHLTIEKPTNTSFVYSWASCPFSKLSRVSRWHLFFTGQNLIVSYLRAHSQVLAYSSGQIISSYTWSQDCFLWTVEDPPVFLFTHCCRLWSTRWEQDLRSFSVTKNLLHILKSNMNCLTLPWWLKR